MIPGAAGAAVLGSGAAVWVPSDIPNLVLGLDNQLITHAGGLVTAWPDTWGPGNHFTQASPTIQPSYVVSEADFPTAQPAVKFDVANSRLQGASIAGVAWMAVVGVYPAATFASYSGLITALSGGGTEPADAFPLRGENGTATWRTTTGPAGTRYRDGTATNTALTTANAPHLYEFIPTVPWTSPATILVGGDTTSPGRQWRDSVALVLMATSVPDALTRAALLTYCQGRGMIP